MGGQPPAPFWGPGAEGSRVPWCRRGCVRQQGAEHGLAQAFLPFLPFLPPAAPPLRLRPLRFPAMGHGTASPPSAGRGAPKDSQAGSYGAGSKLRAQSLQEQLAQSITQGTHPVPQHPGAAGPRIFGIGNWGCKEVCQQAEPAPGALAPLLPLPCPGPGCRSRPQASQALSHAANL